MTTNDQMMPMPFPAQTSSFEATLTINGQALISTDKLSAAAAFTGKCIEEGISKPYASNGTPMEQLHGCVKQTALLKNIGGDMETGLGIIMLHSALNGAMSARRAAAELPFGENEGR